jgi:hypothetical protein
VIYITNREVKFLDIKRSLLELFGFSREEMIDKPVDIREKFFEPYTTTGKEGGTGLGTHNALLVARIHKGDISFTTSEQEGTHVTGPSPRRSLLRSK